jgi:hypothetical protein
VVRARPWSRCAARVTTGSCTAARLADGSSGCFSCARRADGTSSNSVAACCTLHVSVPTGHDDAAPSRPLCPCPRHTPMSRPVRRLNKRCWCWRQHPASLPFGSASGPWTLPDAFPWPLNAPTAQCQAADPIYLGGNLAAAFVSVPATGGSPTSESPNATADALGDHAASHRCCNVSGHPFPRSPHQPSRAHGPSDSPRALALNSLFTPQLQRIRPFGQRCRRWPPSICSAPQPFR